MTGNISGNSPFTPSSSNSRKRPADDENSSTTSLAQHTISNKAPRISTTPKEVWDAIRGGDWNNVRNLIERIENPEQFNLHFRPNDDYGQEPLCRLIYRTRDLKVYKVFAEKFPLYRNIQPRIFSLTPQEQYIKKQWYLGQRQQGLFSLTLPRKNHPR